MMNKLRPYGMIAPSIAIFGLFFIYPILYMIYLSFHDWNFVSPVKDFVGIGNFKALFAEREFIEVMQNTFTYTALTVSLTVAVSLLLALWLNRQGALYGFVQGAIFSPHIISLVSVSMLWMWLMDTDYGLLNWFLNLFGIANVPWLTDPGTSLFSLVIVAVWKGIGFNTLIFIAGLQSIPKDIYEAAELDEANKARTFFKLTLPMLSPTLFFLTIISLIASFQVFETIAIMTQGGPINSTNTFVFYIYEYGFRFFKIGYASAAGVLLLILVSLLTIVYFRLLSRRVHYR
ncbi:MULTISPECIES: carbohydrate ABC transporter permease [Bacillaceae]|jgi:sn-glycerol 3-phosphate transport system permease protein|uniref:ABC transporter permease n=2 Tax=Bacillus infantis TaxID=324767 RepID=U5L6M1_9BACI|nr:MULTISPECIES: sugar ABC transporter permease [Bacillus]AGX03060.1 ABC transporter permease [Bacillus infantis NRRL B-14911]EAR64234.1 sugar ABC transporter, permease protein [Bacillus sp. NRRL B-14911]MDW2879079.1 sugar ABC transporter permease [Bacillus infantis]OXT16116.1 ABC transporter permease [Bacillus sp. OG2]